MPYPVNIGDKVEVRFYSWWEAAKQIAINTVRFKLTAVTSGPNPVDSDDLCNAISNKYAPLFKDCLSTEAEYRGASLQDFPSRIYTPEWSTEGAGNGTQTGDPLPGQISGLIHLQTAYSGRRGAGRLYIPFPAESDNDSSGIPNATYLTVLQALADKIQFPVIVTYTTVVDVVMAPMIENAKGTGLAVRSVLTARGEARWANQRRRGDFGKTNVLPAPLQ